MGRWVLYLERGYKKNPVKTVVFCETSLEPTTPPQPTPALVFFRFNKQTNLFPLLSELLTNIYNVLKTKRGVVKGGCSTYYGISFGTLPFQIKIRIIPTQTISRRPIVMDNVQILSCG